MEGEIIIPNTINDIPVTSINRCAFRNCHNLVSLDISDGIIGIGESAFENCTNLNSITLRNNLKYIEKKHFIIVIALIQ